MGNTEDSRGSVNLKGALLGLLSAIFILAVELVGQYQIESSLKPQLEALRSQYAYSQRFYQRQLEVFEGAMTIVRQIENGARLARLNGDTSKLLGALASWKEWQDESHLYMSLALQEAALKTTRSGTQVISPSHGDKRSNLHDLADRVDQVKNRLRREARDPSTHLQGEEI